MIDSVFIQYCSVVFFVTKRHIIEFSSKYSSNRTIIRLISTQNDTQNNVITSVELISGLEYLKLAHTTCSIIYQRQTFCFVKQMVSQVIELCPNLEQNKFQETTWLLSKLDKKIHRIDMLTIFVSVHILKEVLFNWRCEGRSGN